MENLAKGSAFLGGGELSTSISPKKASLASRFFIVFREQFEARLVFDAARLSLELARDMLDEFPSDFARLVLDCAILMLEGGDGLFRLIEEMDMFFDILSIKGDFGEPLGDVAIVKENLLGEDCSCTDMDLTMPWTLPCFSPAIPEIMGLGGSVSLRGIGVDLSAVECLLEKGARVSLMLDFRLLDTTLAGTLIVIGMPCTAFTGPDWGTDKVRTSFGDTTFGDGI